MSDSQTSQSYFARLQRGDATLPPVTTMLGGIIRSFDAEAGTFVTDYEAQPAFMNPAGQVQGGMLSAMLDDVTAFLVTATLGEREYCATLNLNVSFLRPAQVGALQGRATLVRRGREVCNVTGEIWQAGKLIATAVATCMILSLDPHPAEHQRQSSTGA